MANSRRNSPSWHQPSPQDLIHVERLTRLEVTQEDHGERLDHHDEKHDTQDAWNKAFALALGVLSSGLAHAKAGELLDLALGLLKALKS